MGVGGGGTIVIEQQFKKVKKNNSYMSALSHNTGGKSPATCHHC